MCGEGACPGTTHKYPRRGGRDAGLRTDRSLRERQAVLSCTRRPCAISPVAQKENRHVRPRDCHTHHALRSVSGERATRSAQHKSARNETLQLCVCAAVLVFRVSLCSIRTQSIVSPSLQQPSAAPKPQKTTSQGHYRRRLLTHCTISLSSDT